METEQSRFDEITSSDSKYLEFLIDEDSYAIEILKIREIIGMMDITNIPKTPEYIKGVINLRGKVIPIMDLRGRFGMGLIDYTDRTCIIVVDISVSGAPLRVGLVVDKVSEVLNISGDEIAQPPDFGPHSRMDFILGMAKNKGDVKILLDIDKVLSCKEADLLGQAGN